jgi:hypothetical protein
MKRTIAALPLALTCALSVAGCGDDEAADGAPPAPVEHPVLTEQDLQRFMATTREIRAMGPVAGASGGIERAALQNGYPSLEEFQRSSSFIALALSRVNLGVQGGFGDVGQRSRIEDQLRTLDAEARADEQNAALSAADRNLREAARRERRAELEDQMEHDALISAAVERQHEGIPRETLELINEHRQELMALLAPSPPSPTGDR